MRNMAHLRALERWILMKNSKFSRKILLLTIMICMSIIFMSCGNSDKATLNESNIGVDTKVKEDAAFQKEDADSEFEDNLDTKVDVDTKENVDNDIKVDTNVTVVKYSFRNQKLLNQHYEKHGIDMGFASAEEYENAASAVVTNPNALHKIESEDGDDIYYIEETNEFVVVSTDGYLRTYFYPDAGKKYYDRQ